MPALDRQHSVLVVIDFQMRLMPQIEDGSTIAANARRLLDVAVELEVPVLFTEHNPSSLGPTIAELLSPGPVIVKQTFDACAAPEFLGQLKPDVAIVIAGCEAHVCVLQTVLGLRAQNRRVYVVRDAIGSRRSESKETALGRMERHGAEIITAEMAAFEWLYTYQHPKFSEILKLIK